MKRILGHGDVYTAASNLTNKIVASVSEAGLKNISLYAVNRGGVPVLYLVLPMLRDALREKDVIIEVTRLPMQATHIIDDIIDSGDTYIQFKNLNDKCVFCSLFVKRNDHIGVFPNNSSGEQYKVYETYEGVLFGEFIENQWIVFPWELQNETTNEGIQENIVRILQYIGESPQRDGLKETPKRVQKAWEHWTRGYAMNAKEVFKTFSLESLDENVNEMIVIKDIPFYSHCEHHMAPFFGSVTIAYIPGRSILGLSKFSRLVDIFANRLQVQERMTKQIADSIEEHLKPLGTGVLVKARHLCMESRGISKQGSCTVTSALKGVFKVNTLTRAEFMSLAKE